MLQKMRIEEEINDSCNCITLCGEIIDCPKEDQKSHLSISTASGHEKGIHVLTIKTKSRVELCGVVWCTHYTDGLEEGYQTSGNFQNTKKVQP